MITNRTGQQPWLEENIRKQVTRQGVFSLSTNMADEISAQMKSRGYTLETRRSQELTGTTGFYWCKQYSPEE